MNIRNDVIAQVLGAALGNTGPAAPLWSCAPALIATMRSKWSAL
jgi:hypothetical protein